MPGDIPPESVPVSLLLRQEVKKKASRTGIVFIVLSVPLIGVSVMMFARGGAEALGGVTGLLGVGMLGLGISMVRKAMAAR